MHFILPVIDVRVKCCTCIFGIFLYNWCVRLSRNLLWQPDIFFPFHDLIMCFLHSDHCVNVNSSIITLLRSTRLILYCLIPRKISSSNKLVWHALTADNQSGNHGYLQTHCWFAMLNVCPQIIHCYPPFIIGVKYSNQCQWLKCVQTITPILITNNFVYIH